jgi:hypothetical protein
LADNRLVSSVKTQFKAFKCSSPDFTCISYFIYNSRPFTSFCVAIPLCPVTSCIYDYPFPRRHAALTVLNGVFGYSDFRGSQAAIVNHVVNGGDALVLMPTGGGKSLLPDPAIVRQQAGHGVDGRFRR